MIKAKSHIKYRDLTLAESPRPYSNKPPVEVVLGESVLHRSGRLVSDAKYDVAVDIERYRYGGMPEEFLNVLGMNAPAKE